MNYLFTDCETAETSINGKVDATNGQAYDIGMMVMNDKGEILKKVSLVNEDVFFGMPEAMEKAYFADKIPQYLADMRQNKRQIVNTWQGRKIMRELCEEYNVQGIVAHNARFDVTALNATMRYQSKSKCRYFMPYGVQVLDTMKMAQETFGNDPAYIAWCEEHGYMTNHQTPRPRMTAEVLYRYIMNDNEFEESHTGLEDVEIEAVIFLKCMEKMGK